MAAMFVLSLIRKTDSFIFSPIFFLDLEILGEAVGILLLSCIQAEI